MAQAGLAIRGARILDGTGAPPREGDLEVRDGRISTVGSAGPAAREIDATGLVLAPGFVDTHTHDDGALLRHPGLEFKLAQGCTSLVIGNCGFSAVPWAPPSAGARGAGGLFGDLEPDFSDLEGFRARLERTPPALNAIALVGHNTIRSLELGAERRAPTRGELHRMRGHVERALEQGACGFSTGLIYRPGRFSTTDEVIACAEPLAGYGALYATHMRNEGDRLLDAVDEAVRIGREAGCAVHISHHKAAGRPNWGRVADSLARVDAANAAGADVTLDVYPYTAGSGPMIEYFDLDNISEDYARTVGIASCPDFREYEGKMVPELAKELGLSIADTVRHILRAPRAEQTLCIHFIIDEADIETNLRHPLVMVGSDGIPDLSGKPHPRLYGTFPRVLGEYVRRRGVLTLEEAVRRMTSLSCERFGLVGRGRIAEGFFADLVLFDPERIRDVATYEDPKREPEGVHTVVVNGAIAYDRGRHTGARAGRLLRYRSEREDR
jgi:N-acyl-D-amino-acid deacylase